MNRKQEQYKQTIIELRANYRRQLLISGILHLIGYIIGIYALWNILYIINGL